MNAVADLPRTVLLVEDNPGDAELIRDLLAEAPNTRFGSILHVMRLSEAIEVLRQRAVEVVLLDLRLPDAAGVSCVDAVRADARDVPIVVLTGLEDEELARSCIAAGAQDYLSKQDVHSRTLVRAIDYAVARADQLIERRRAYELARENERIAEANRLKSQFIANMSHELRTPLNAIIGFTELIHDGKVDPASPPFGVFVGHILTSARHLLQLINDLLDLAKVEAGRLETHCELADLAPLVHEVATIMQPAFDRKAIRFEIALDPAAALAWVDPHRFKQVLFNYLSNASKFTPPSGQVVLSSRLADQDTVEIEIRDSGPGIARADLEKLFSEFHQLRSATGAYHPGTGLGLALTKRLVEAQSGTVFARSELGRGSVFGARFRRATATKET